MGKDSGYLVFFEGTTTIDDAERAFRKAGMFVTRTGDDLTVTWKNSPEFNIGINAKDWVPIEAEEVAERHQLPAIAKCKRRFEVAFDDLEAVLDEYNTLFETQMTLLTLTNGYCQNTWNGVLFLGNGDVCPCAECSPS